MNIKAEKRFAIVIWSLVVLVIGLWCLFAFGFDRAHSSIIFLVMHGILGFLSLFVLARFYAQLKGLRTSRAQVLALMIFAWLAVTGFILIHLFDNNFLVSQGDHSAVWYTFLILALTSELASLVIGTEIGLVAFTDNEKAHELELRGIRAIKRN